MADYLPGKVYIRSFYVDGHDMRLHLKKADIFYSMCKPYATGKFLLIDNNNVVNALELSGQEPITFDFDAGDVSHHGTQYILSIDGEESTDSSRTMIYTISTVSASYFMDKSSLVQKSFMTQTPSAAAAAIHGQYIANGSDPGLSLDAATQGFIATQQSGGYQTMNKKPFVAIKDLLNLNTWAGYKTGLGIYFCGYDNFHMGPAQYYFDSCSARTTVEQRSTWGARYEDIWVTTNAILAARTVKNEDQGGGGSGRGGGGGLAQGAQKALSIWDNFIGKDVISKGASAAAGVGSALGASGLSRFTGKGGGSQGVFSMNSLRTPLANDQSMNAAAEAAYLAKIKNAVNQLVKIPIQSGFLCDVGHGINLKLLAPTGDQDSGVNQKGGLYLVADLQHEIWADDRPIQATTIMRCVAGLKG